MSDRDIIQGVADSRLDAYLRSQECQCEDCECEDAEYPDVTEPADVNGQGQSECDCKCHDIIYPSED